MFIPESIQKQLIGKKCVKDKIGKSGSSVYLYDDVVLKIEKAGENAENELRILRWLDGKIAVPKIISVEIRHEFQYILMTRLPGKMLCAPEFLKDRRKIFTVISDALNVLWSIPEKACPYVNSIENKLRLAEYRVHNRLAVFDDVEPETIKEFGTPENLLAWLKSHRPQTEELIFTHGDLCLPNIFCTDGGAVGFVDLGGAGVADKWQDISLLWRSLKYNLSGRCSGAATNDTFDENGLFSCLGIAPDREKMRYYLLLDELF